MVIKVPVYFEIICDDPKMVDHELIRENLQNFFQSERGQFDFRVEKDFLDDWKRIVDYFPKQLVGHIKRIHLITHKEVLDNLR
jgi:hypothetical protein